MDSATFLLEFRSTSQLRLYGVRTSLHTGLTACTGASIALLAYPSVSLLLSNAKGSAGISTGCPSPTTIVLGLGPDLP